ncbi:MAG: DNA translocase FtsK, partial [Lachnospiraceae bacterium]|nr:DNA translocase FtsK [Lachnospiraceae bacterium]
LGKGDMLYYPTGMQRPLRVQGALVTDEEIGKVVDFLKEGELKADYDKVVIDSLVSPKGSSLPGSSAQGADPFFAEAGKYIIEKDKASIGMLQRVFKIGFNRAARIMDQLAEAGAVGPEEGTKPRKILMTIEEFEQYLKDNDIE